jgi:hypothetical protein
MELILPAGKEKARFPCPKCVREGVFLEYSPEQRTASGPWAPESLTKVLIGTGLVLAVTWAFVRLWRGPAPRAGEEKIFEIPCPVCRRGVRFRQDQVGQKGPCPFCESTCTFPDPTADLEEFDSNRAVKKWAKAMKGLPRRKKGPP